MNFVLIGVRLQMGIKEDNDEVTVKTRILSLELLQVSFLLQAVESLFPMVS